MLSVDHRPSSTTTSDSTRAVCTGGASWTPSRRRSGSITKRIRLSVCARDSLWQCILVCPGQSALGLKRRIERTWVSGAARREPRIEISDAWRTHRTGQRHRARYVRTADTGCDDCAGNKCYPARSRTYGPTVRRRKRRRAARGAHASNAGFRRASPRRRASTTADASTSPCCSSHRNRGKDAKSRSK